jgi:hypothetical protein
MADGENRDERLQRETMELLNELRVILPGVQVLLAFLLTAPFNQRFNAISPAERATYFVALLATAAATAFLIAPSTYHRIRFRDSDREHMLKVANALTLVGTMFLAVGIVTAIALVTSVLYDSGLTVMVASSVAVLFLWLWYGLPSLRKLRGNRRAAQAGETS